MQAAVKTNVTYDLSRFDKRSAVRRAAEKEKAASREAAAKPAARAKVKAQVTPFAIFSFCVCMALAILMIFSYMQLSEISEETAGLKKQLLELREENQMLEIENSRRLSNETIKEEAEGRLGMQKLDKSQITYLDMGSGNRVEIPDDTRLMRESELVAGIVSGFRTIVEYIN